MPFFSHLRGFIVILDVVNWLFKWETFVNSLLYWAFWLQLRLHPIHAVVQLRSSFEHLNSGGSKKKSTISTSANSSVKIEESTEEKSVTPLKKQVLSSNLYMPYHCISLTKD